MATITSHTLNGTDGTHAGGIGVTLIDRISGAVLVASETDIGGRLSLVIPDHKIDPHGSYELVFATGAYWASRSIPRDGAQIVDEVVIRFSMPDPGGRYHLPVILAPNSHSVWWSS